MDPQATYFNKAKNQFSPESVLHPSIHHLLEYHHLLELIHPQPTHTIVDLGAGSGRLSLYLLKQGLSVTAVDVSKGSLKQLAILYRTHKEPGWGKLQTSYLLPAKKADYIFGADILHHLNLPQSLPQLYRHLKPGGLVAFSEPNGSNLLWYLYLLKNRIPWSIEKNLLHTTTANLAYQFRRLGFQNLTIQGHGLLPTPLWPSLLNRRLGNLPLLRHLAFRLLITAQKPR